MTIQRFSAPGFAVPANGAPVFAIRLIDRRTGEVPRLNGNPIGMLTSTPRLAVEELMRGRDPSKWTAQIEQLGLTAIKRPGRPTGQS